MLRAEALNVTAIIVFCGFFCAVAFHYALASYFGLGYPFSTFLFRPDNCFRDFSNMYGISGDRSPYNSNHFFQSNYLPLPNLLFWFFSVIPSKYLSLSLFLGIFLVVYALFIGSLCFANKEKALSILVIACCAYPLLFSIDRGNIEIYLFLFVGAFFYFYYTDRHILSVICLSIAISMKIYPGIFILILVKDKKVKLILLALGLCVAFFILPLLAFKGGVINNILSMLHEFRKFFGRSFDVNGIQYSPTLFGVIKLIVLSYLGILGKSAPGYVPSRAIELAMSKPYAAIVIVLFLAICIVIFVKKDLRTFEIAQVLVSILVLFPYVSYDYKLICFLIPFFMFIYDTGDLGKRVIMIYSICYGLLFIPKDYVIIIGGLSINVPINLAIMTFMILFTLLKKSVEQIFETDPHRRIL